jgi:hypothetical protein
MYEDESYQIPCLVYALLVLMNFSLAAVHVPKVQGQLGFRVSHPFSQCCHSCAIPLTCSFHEIEVRQQHLPQIPAE